MLLAALLSIAHAASSHPNSTKKYEGGCTDVLTAELLAEVHNFLQRILGLLELAAQAMAYTQTEPGKLRVERVGRDLSGLLGASHSGAKIANRQVAEPHSPVAHDQASDIGVSLAVFYTYRLIILRIIGIAYYLVFPR